MAPESFSNGYEFKWASIIYSEDLDENKESIWKYEGISIEYAKTKTRILFSVYRHPLLYESGTNLVQKKGKAGEAPFSAVFQDY